MTPDLQFNYICKIPPFALEEKMHQLYGWQHAYHLGRWTGGSLIRLPQTYWIEMYC